MLLDRLKKCECCVLGPGLGRSEALIALVRSVLENCAVPLVLDADALYAVSRDKTMLQSARCPVVVTPHGGEFTRLGGALTGDPAADARAFAGQYGCVTVLKGPETAVAFPDGCVFLSRFGNPGMVASCGVKIAKMSGRGLGHTGGTIDKLESFPGYSTSISEEKFIENVNRIGIAITGQTAEIDPADKKLYALRDVTGTVPSIPLIVSSIMSCFLSCI